MNMEGCKTYYSTYKQIASELSFIEEIIGNMSSNPYRSLDTYLNNIKIVSAFYKKIKPWMSDTGFIDYLKKKDADRYIQIIATGNSIVFMTNLLANLDHDLKSRSRELTANII